MSETMIGYTEEEITRIVDSIQCDTPRTREQVDLMNHLQLEIAHNEGAVRVRKLIMNRVNELKRRGKWS